MAEQLALLDHGGHSEQDHRERDWRLDEHTRQVGRQGLAAAREALAQAARAAAHPAAGRRAA